MSTEVRALRVFISYSHADSTWREKLGKHLSLLERQGIVEVWHDRRITAGQHWAETIDEKLREADVVLLLVSADFIASDYCYSLELEAALDQDKRGRSSVVPILLRKCDWESAPFARCQAIPRDNKPVAMHPHGEDAALAEVAEELRRLAQKRRASALIATQAVTRRSSGSFTNGGDTPVSARASTRVGADSAADGDRRRVSRSRQDPGVTPVPTGALDLRKGQTPPAIREQPRRWARHQRQPFRLGAAPFVAISAAVGLLTVLALLIGRDEDEKAREPDTLATRQGTPTHSASSPPPRGEEGASTINKRVERKGTTAEDRATPLHRLLPLQEVSFQHFATQLYWCDRSYRELTCTFILRTDEMYVPGPGRDPNRVTLYVDKSRALDRDGGEYAAHGVQLGNDSGYELAQVDLASSVSVRGSVAYAITDTQQSDGLQLIAINIQGPGGVGNPLIYFRNMTIGERKRPRPANR